ncbi:uncharacterized mitochondrial protein-like protein [Tanacetum coccineum]
MDNPPNQHQYNQPESDNYSFVTNLNKTYEPKSYKEAASDPRWIEAMNAEMEALIRNMTWVVTELPSGRRPIGTAKPSKVPLYVGKSNKPVKVVDGDDKNLSNISCYQKLIGKLIYLTITRPDIAYVVHKLSQVMHSPKQSDLRLAFKVLRYLKGSPGKGILYEKSNEFNVSAYVDSDWAKCTATRRSITGYAVYLGDSLISWRSKKQNVLARSSAEAEFRAMSNVTCEVIWVLKILTELKVNYDTPVNMFCDIAANPVFHERTKHFEIDLFFLREKITDGVIKTCKIKSEENVADILTKGLSIDEHKKFCSLLHLVDSFQGSPGTESANL